MMKILKIPFMMISTIYKLIVIKCKNKLLEYNKKIKKINKITFFLYQKNEKILPF